MKSFFSSPASVGYTAANTALLALLTQTLPTVTTKMGIGPEAGNAAADFLKSHTALLPMLYTSNPLTASLPWLLTAGSTVLGAAAPNTPILGTFSKVAQAATAASTTGAAGMGLGGTLANQLALSGLSALFHLDQPAAWVALGAAGYTGAVTSGILHALGITSGALKGMAALVPMAVASFLVTTAMLMLYGSRGGRHGLSFHTLVHAGGVAVASAFASTLGLAPGLSSLVQPGVAVAALKALQKVVV